MGIGLSMNALAKTRSILPAGERRRFLLDLAQRDARLNDAFVYAVRSTGIYCRPSCPSRRPHPKQVVLFAWPKAAERAGFRPCRRCHPDQMEHNPQSVLVRHV